jgi:hypothetical protein
MPSVLPRTSTAAFGGLLQPPGASRARLLPGPAHQHDGLGEHELGHAAGVRVGRVEDRDAATCAPRRGRPGWCRCRSTRWLNRRDGRGERARRQLGARADADLCLHLGIDPAAVEQIVFAAATDAEIDAQLLALFPADVRAANGTATMCKRA